MNWTGEEVAERKHYLREVGLGLTEMTGCTFVQAKDLMLEFGAVVVEGFGMPPSFTALRLVALGADPRRAA